jgi:hypothetical protein
VGNLVLTFEGGVRRARLWGTVYLILEFWAESRRTLVSFHFDLPVS